MIEHLRILPAPDLAAYIYYYRLRTFSTHGMDLLVPWYAIPETELILFLQGRPIWCKDEATGYYVEGDHDIAVLGLSDRFNGMMLLNGSYLQFEIIFMPNGFHRLFSLPPLPELANRIFNADAYLGTTGKLLREELQEAPNISAMRLVADKFFRSRLSKRTTGHGYDGIAKISSNMLQLNGMVNISYYAREANMSMRNFERRFSQQVGTTPKLFCRMLRFNKVIQYKLSNPSSVWSDIASRFHYHDTMHLVRDFKDFAGSAPALFFNTTPPPRENYIYYKSCKQKRVI
ncbi:MAG: AraC family transcriptional regulator [Sphingobacteriales bacterium]|nr:AraC family transcriptional regulator [Sphingobacteriales bacterium]OJY81855.1 MAG: hypothetical protein BGP14_03600 [Sphingobacteriales bacterium 44-15]